MLRFVHELDEIEQLVGQRGLLEEHPRLTDAQKTP